MFVFPLVLFPSTCKSAILLPFINKLSLDLHVLKNYKPVSNFSFLSKQIGKVIYSRILKHIGDFAYFLNLIKQPYFGYYSVHE